MIVVRNFFLRICGIIAGKLMHNMAFLKLIRSPSWFFDINPVGRILSRFSKDFEIIDQILIDIIGQFLNLIFNVFGTFFIVIYYTNGIFLVPLIPVTLIYAIVYAFYKRTQRELQRIESINRTPLYSHFSGFSKKI